jgi:DNA-binding transcriptional LysR family regulator
MRRWTNRCRRRPSGGHIIKLQLTPEGTAFYERCLGVLADIEEAEREAAGGDENVRTNSLYSPLSTPG